MSNNIIIYLPLFLFLLLFLPSASVHAVDFSLPGGIHTEAEGTPGIIDDIYRFSLFSAGILAFGAIVYGGIKYTFAAGNPSGQSEGKEWVKGALLGLLLLAGAYLILRTINPQLVQLRLPTL
ncbi:MAG: hypothetical protein AAB897_03655 [Patescibacteria group bacterium]